MRNYASVLTLLACLCLQAQAQEKPQPPQQPQQPQPPLQLQQQPPQQPKLMEIFSASKQLKVEFPTAGLDSLRPVTLYVSTNPADGWGIESAGYIIPPDQFNEKAAPNSFSRNVNVPYDSTFYFTVDQSPVGSKTSGQPTNPAPRLKVIVDTTPTAILITSPIEGTKLTPGAELRITWQATDPNFGATPIALWHSVDDSNSWYPIRREMANSGLLAWTVPDTGGHPMSLRIDALDQAGNLKQATINLQVAPKMAAAKPGPAYQPNKPALVAFTMAGNLVRQGKYQDALRYYLNAIDSDSVFVSAMSDAALVYKALGKYDEGEALVQRALAVKEKDDGLWHNLGEMQQARGFALLQRGEIEAGEQQIMAAIKSYAQSISLAEQNHSIAARAASYFRLGEISYYANADLAGARAYWQKVMDLFAPTPDIFEPADEYKRHTEMKIGLYTWQRWSEQYLRQLDSIEQIAIQKPQAPAEPQVTVEVHNDSKPKYIPGLTSTPDPASPIPATETGRAYVSAQAAAAAQPPVAPEDAAVYAAPVLTPKPVNAATAKAEAANAEEYKDKDYWQWERHR